MDGRGEFNKDTLVCVQFPIWLLQKEKSGLRYLYWKNSYKGFSLWLLLPFACQFLNIKHPFRADRTAYILSAVKAERWFLLSYYCCVTKTFEVKSILERLDFCVTGESIGHQCGPNFTQSKFGCKGWRCLLIDTTHKTWVVTILKRGQQVRQVPVLRFWGFLNE